LRERIKACADAAELHGMIAGWQSTQAWPPFALP
jgi:PTS system nitrogen regulatory IIA component